MVNRLLLLIFGMRVLTSVSCLDSPDVLRFIPPEELRELLQHQGIIDDVRGYDAVTEETQSLPFPTYQSVRVLSHDDDVSKLLHNVPSSSFLHSARNLKQDSIYMKRLQKTRGIPVPLFKARSVASTMEGGNGRMNKKRGKDQPFAKYLKSSFYN